MSQFIKGHSQVRAFYIFLKQTNKQFKQSLKRKLKKTRFLIFLYFNRSVLDDLDLWPGNLVHVHDTKSHDETIVHKTLNSCYLKIPAQRS
jgi:hypothetical protein